MAKRGKTVRRGRGRGRTQRRGRTHKRGRTQRRGRAYRQQGGLSTKEKAIAFMNEIHVAPRERAEFIAKLRELGNDENALKTIMNDNEYIGHLMRFENQAIAYMNEIHLAQDKRAEFMAKFRELGGDQNAVAEMVTYRPVVLTSAKEVQQQYPDSSLSQHYASAINYTQPKSNSYDPSAEWRQNNY